MDPWPRWLPLCLAPILAVQAFAQAPDLDPMRYAPLDVGNRWEYVFQDESHAPASPLGYVVAEVEGEMMIGGEPYRVLAQQSLTLDGSPAGPRARCAYSLASGAASAEAAGLPDYDCSILPVPPTLPHPYGPTTVETDAPFEVGDQSYIADSLVTYGHQISGSGGQYSALSWKSVQDVGLLSRRSWGQQNASTCSTSPSTCTYSNATRLEFAQVGGVTYGAGVVAEEPLPETRLRLRAWPNPAEGAQSLRIDGFSGPVVVSVVDALGRQIWRGEVGDGSMRLPEVAPGLYAIEARTGSQRASIQILRL